MTQAGPTGLDRTLAPTRALENGESQAAFFGTYEYVVVTATPTQIDANPTDPSVGVPPLQNRPLRFGVPGTSATLTPGTLVLIQFINGAPSRPCVVGYDGTPPQTMQIAADTLGLGTAPAFGVGMGPQILAKLELIFTMLTAEAAVWAAAAPASPVTITTPQQSAIAAALAAYSTSFTIPIVSLTVDTSP